MSWSIADVARMSHVTARTLRHYDAIGLLPPARVGANGYRYYEREQLLRLQQILLLREMGLDLATIAKVLDGEHDRLDALRRHHERLVAEGARLARLAGTVADTIAQLEGGAPMPDENLFEGFSFTPETLAEIETRSVARHGDSVRTYFDEIAHNTSGWTAEDYAGARREATEFEGRVYALFRDGVAPDDPRVLDLVARDYAAQGRLWSPDPESYAALGEAFVRTPSLRAHLDAQDPRLAEYLRDAMVVYAGTRAR